MTKRSTPSWATASLLTVKDAGAEYGGVDEHPTATNTLKPIMSFLASMQTLGLTPYEGASRCCQLGAHPAYRRDHGRVVAAV